MRVLVLLGSPRKGGNTLLGSPRKGGNTDILADEFLRGAADAGAEAEKVCLDDLRIRPIGEVSDRPAERADTRADDDFPAVLEKFLAADVVCFASPVYWQGVTAQLKCFLDRLSGYRCRPEYGARFGGKGFAVLTAFGQTDPDHGKWVIEPIKVGVRVLGGRYLGEVSVSVFKKAAVRAMPQALQAAFNLGKTCTETMRPVKE
jgi:NAD(P)H-dependent FMN reductase